MRFLDRIILAFIMGLYFDAADDNRILSYLPGLRLAIIYENYGKGSYLLSVFHFEA